MSYVLHARAKPFLARASVSQSFIEIAKNEKSGSAPKRRQSVMVLSRQAAASKSAQYT